MTIRPPKYAHSCWLRIVFAVCLSVVLLGASALSTLAESLRVESVAIETGSGVHLFKAEIADTAISRSRGLMFRKKLGPNQAMLFDFETDQPVMMWMRNTFIPLDMVFIKANGRIHRIERNTKPFSEKIVPAGALVRAVLEVAAGTANRLAVQPGDLVRHRMFDPKAH